MSPDLSAFLNPDLCANTARKIGNQLALCQNVATNTCAKCKLVQYCSKGCQTADWKIHQKTCKSPLMKEQYEPRWVQEGRLPLFMRTGPDLVSFGANKYLWGNVPALDILNIKDNEGIRAVDQDFTLLFAASGDIRNLVKTIVGLPENYRAKCEVICNDWDFPIVARNAIMLLAALRFEPETAVPIMIHIWYSALLPARIAQAVEDCLLPYIDDVCTKVKDKDASSLLGKTFKIRGRSLRLVLKKGEWFRLCGFFKIPAGLRAIDAQSVRQRTMMAPERVDYVDRALYRQSPAIRMGMYRFRVDGVLLPFGASRKDFDTPNPTFYQDQNIWPMKDSADPLSGWNYCEYIKHAPIARDDVYGSLFFFLRDLLLQFCRRLQSRDMRIQLLNMDAQGLPIYLKEAGQGKVLFDRIELANICDRGYIGPENTLLTFSPLLKPKNQNPKATMLMLFLNAVQEGERLSGGPSSVDFPSILGKLKKYIRIDEFKLLPIFGPGSGNPELVRITSCFSMFADFDKYFRRFLRDVRMDQLAKKFGMRIKNQHSIIEPWPFRVTNNTTKHEFEILCAANTIGHERYVEWEKLG
ncbi:uncharacterized protein BDR25DRAFT_325695 [Lindgomyces ingoldianus]|uniref:Uncharacterized protein n=1 Tax=Lindgomyces ingoldianus TaxID=673940 RepID=A0ACB6QU13_9PLEO|nr:uncharacterized protein BDR25DRAFT_325695 [Lindgomyces ingoldianus]KAF2470499.1 hypothetical protein BDR25DRAFT_325695 [Lindgomyces ingoldianus]